MQQVTQSARTWSLETVAKLNLPPFFVFSVRQYVKFHVVKDVFIHLQYVLCDDHLSVLVP